MNRRKHPSRRRAIVAVLGALIALVAIAPAGAQAAGTWNCRASALRVKLFDQAPVEPIVANGNSSTCRTDSAGLPDLGASLPLGLGADAASALTTQGGTDPTTQQPAAHSEIANLRIPGTNAFLTVVAAATDVSGGCANRAPVFAGRNSTARLFLGTTEIPTNQIVEQVVDGVTGLTGAILKVIPHEEVRNASSYTRRALHISLTLGGANIVDAIAAEGTISVTGNPCTPSTTTGTGIDNPTNNPDYPGLPGTPHIGDDWDGATSVVGLSSTLLQPRNSPCLSSRFGRGVAIVGSNRNDRVVGSRGRDRIFVLRANDTVFAGYGNDCVEGAEGSDTVLASRGNDWLIGRDNNDRLFGMLGNDRLYGNRGNDYLHGLQGSDLLYGGPGNDLLIGSFGNDTSYGGSGNDNIVPGPGNDKVYSGPGNDLVDAIGPGKEYVDCGTGKDRAYVKKGDTWRNCEQVFVRPVRLKPTTSTGSRPTN
jgi:Ca2+-binding RTX toxin-like protein